MSIHRYLFSATALCFFAYFILARVSLYLSRRRFQAENGCKPVQAYFPSRDPFFGLDLMRETIQDVKNLRFLESTEHRFQQLGTSTFRSRLVGQSFINTIEPQNLKTMLSTRSRDYGIPTRKHIFGPLLGNSVLVAEGESWAQSRALLRPAFARDQLADLPLLERHIKDLFLLIPRDGSTVDLQELFFRFTIDSATEFLLGYSVHSLRAAIDGHLEDRFTWAFDYALTACMTRIRLGALSKFWKDPKDRKAIKMCHEFVDRFVNDAIRYRETHNHEKHAATEEGYVFLHELAQATDDRRKLRDELLTLLLAGRDTTASLLGNLFFDIAKDPAIWEKLQKEVAKLGGVPPDYNQLRKLKYLKYCLNESLRLHPVLPSNARIAICDTVLPLGGGPDGRSPLFVPKGTALAFNMYAMHRRTDYFGPDAGTFRPERWETLRPGWEYLPFSGGSRKCPGQQYALTEASYVTVRILQEFEGIESRDPEPWKEGLSISVCSKNGAKVGLTPRKE